MLSRFHLVLESNGRTDRRTDRWTDRFAISIPHISMLTCDNKIMKISQEDAIPIKNLYLSKPYGAQRLLHEFPRQGLETWKHQWSAE